MVEVMAGIWLFLLTAGAGFLCGRYGSRTRKRVPRQKQRTAHAAGEVGWRELLNFLQYDGSGKLPFDSMERGDMNGETENYAGTGAERVHRRRPL